MRNNEDRLGINKNLQSDLPLQAVQQNNLNLNFITPTEYVDLPSAGKFYPVGHPLKGVETIEIKQMTAKEEDILTNRSFLKKGIALEKLLDAVIIDKNIKSEDLLVCDRNAIFVSLRITGYGPEYTTHLTCPQCEKKSKNSFDLKEKLEESYEEINANVDENGYFIIELPSTKWSVKCRALIGSDEKKLLNVLSNKVKEDFTLLEQLKMLIVSIQGIEDKETLERALESMPALDSRYLRKQYDLIIPSLDMKGHFTCQHCEYEEVLEVPLTADFFWPK